MERSGRHVETVEEKVRLLRANGSSKMDSAQIHPLQC